MRVFVTVGTTKFPQLVEEVLQDEVTSLLWEMGYRHLEVQAGSTTPSLPATSPLTINCWDYRKSLAQELGAADLVISHAGAGTCLEVLALRKPLLVIVNKALLDNHQRELADRLARDGHCVQGDSVLQALQDYRGRGEELVPFPPGNPALFTSFLADLLGL